MNNNSKPEGHGPDGEDIGMVIVTGDKSDMVKKSTRSQIALSGGKAFSLAALKVHVAADIGEIEFDENEMEKLGEDHLARLTNSYLGKLKARGTRILRLIREGEPVGKKGVGDALVIVADDEAKALWRANPSDIDDAYHYHLSRDARAQHRSIAIQKDFKFVLKLMASAECKQFRDLCQGE